MLRFILIALVSLSPVLGGERLVVCGAAEIFQIDPAAEMPAKLWSWRAKDHAELPADLVKTFASTTDCKPLDGGKRLLICSSSGGCALLEMPSGKALWWARVPNAHSIEALPGGLIAVAASTAAAGNKVLLFDGKAPDQRVSELALHSAHGLVWDDGRKRLWALGFDRLLACALENGKLVVKASHALPDKDGHDLRPVPGSAELILSTETGVSRFDRDTFLFRADPDFADRPETKSIDIQPQTGRIVSIRASGGDWWTDTIDLHHPAAKIRLKGEILYKARWMADEPPRPPTAKDNSPGDDEKRPPHH